MRNRQSPRPEMTMGQTPSEARGLWGAPSRIAMMLMRMAGAGFNGGGNRAAWPSEAALPPAHLARTCMGDGLRLRQW